MAAINLNELLNSKIFRIPDYQRGYAWEQRQLLEFWDDLQDIPCIDGVFGKHYTGTIFLEESNANKNELWLDGFKFYNVIDGQQRLTTIFILLFELINSTEDGFGEEEKVDLIKSYIYRSNKSGESRVYKFMYELSNENNIFLISSIFEYSGFSVVNFIKNSYTNNLNVAKFYFREKINSLNAEERYNLFRKVTNSLIFDIRFIEKDIDVQAVFETMNNRGKSLSILEKLKNRLIYLVERLNSPPEDKAVLRQKINKAWGVVYSYLGKNQEVILHEDEFLSAHLSLIRKPDDYVFSEVGTEKKLFQIFCNNPERHNLNNAHEKEVQVSYKLIDSYIHKLSEMAPVWYDVNFPDSEIIWKINTLNSSKELKIFLTSVILRKEDTALKTEIFFLTESLLFRNWVPGVYVMDARVFANWAREIYSGKSNLIEMIEKIRNSLLSNSVINFNLISGFRSLFNYINGGKGFHRWGGLKYFLFEYEKYLQDFYNESTKKIDRSEYSITTIEHIVPQHYQEFWPQIENDLLIRFDSESKYQATKVLLNTLGNLTILKNGKNSSLGNRSWILKRNRFTTGSYNEINISQHESWTFEEIDKRGRDVLQFLLNKIGAKQLSEIEIQEILYFDASFYSTFKNLK